MQRYFQRKLTQNISIIEAWVENLRKTTAKWLVNVFHLFIRHEFISKESR